LDRNLELKMKVVRAQLGVSLDLFMRHRDPISTHALACGAAEILQGLGEARTGIATVTSHILSSNPNLTTGALRELRNRHWNAIKHFSDHKGQPRNDVDLLEGLTDETNETILFVAWSDYGALGGRLPIAAQVFQVWWLANNEAKVIQGADPVWRRLFPNIAAHDRRERKRRLRRVVEKYESNNSVLADARTDNDPLVPYA
jgi:hypothetical protein